MDPSQDSAANRRVEENLDLVRYATRQLRAEMGRLVDSDEVEAVGRTALVLASRSFDERRGVPFRRWANLRVRWAMVDAIRLATPLPRRMYTRLRQIAAADHVAEAVQEELAAAPPKTAEAADEALSSFLGEAATAMALAIRRPQEFDETRSAVPEPGPSPEDEAASAEMSALCRAAVAALPDRERRVIELFYFEDAPLEVIAKELDISRSWACRIHLKAVSQIQAHLRRRRAAPGG